MVPTDLLLDPGVSSDAVRLWARLDDALRDELRTWVMTRAELGALVDVGWRQAARLSAQLVAGGWMRVAPAGRAGNIYEPLRRPRFDRAAACAQVVNNLGTAMSFDARIRV